MSNLTIDLQNLSSSDKKILMEIIERSNAPEREAWKPKTGDVYYLLSTDGGIAKNTVYSLYDERAYAMGNAFPTREEAEFERERRKFLKKWKDLSNESGEAKNEWDGKNRHWFCHYYVTENKIINDDCICCYKDECTYFATKESLERAIIALGEENVKRYILGVKE